MRQKLLKSEVILRYRRLIGIPDGCDCPEADLAIERALANPYHDGWQVVAEVRRVLQGP